MFLRCKKRRKDGKEHSYWSIVENRRVMGGRILQHHVLYLGELNGCQEASWRRTVELFSHDQSAPQQLSLFPEDHLPQSHDKLLEYKTALFDHLTERWRTLSIRPIHHPLEDRIKAHIFISFLSYCLQVALKARLKGTASGLTPRTVLEEFAAIPPRHHRRHEARREHARCGRRQHLEQPPHWRCVITVRQAGLIGPVTIQQAVEFSGL